MLLSFTSIQFNSIRLKSSQVPFCCEGVLKLLAIYMTFLFWNAEKCAYTVNRVQCWDSHEQRMNVATQRSLRLPQPRSFHACEHSAHIDCAVLDEITDHYSHREALKLVQSLLQCFMRTNEHDIHSLLAGNSNFVAFFTVQKCPCADIS